MNKKRHKRIYVVNKSGHIYDAAEEYGTLVFVSEGTVDRYDANGIWRMWTDALADSRPDDYLLLTSLNILCSIGSAVFARKHGRLNVLLYKQGKYIPRELNL